MTVEELIAQLASLGVTIVNDGGSLRVSGPGAVLDELRGVLLPWKSKLLEALKAPAQMPEVEFAKSANLPVFIDLETRSNCDIKQGGRRYAQDQSTEILSVVALIDDQVIVWTPTLTDSLAIQDLWPEHFGEAKEIRCFAGPELPEDLRAAIVSGRSFCAHNAYGFDAHVWKAAGYPAPSAWCDTLPAARAAGLPGGLNDIGLYLFGRGKDKTGTALIKRLCRPVRIGLLPPLVVKDAVALVRYNIADVLLLAQVFEVVQGFGELDLIQVDQRINERGVAFDSELAQRLLRIEREVAREACEEAERITGGRIKASEMKKVKKIKKWLLTQNVILANLQRATIDKALLVGRLPEAVSHFLRLRQTATRATASKLQRAIEACEHDGRLRDLFAYHVAHTGRWAGKGVQPHNLPKPHPDLNNIDELIAASQRQEDFCRALPATVSIADAVASLIRPCFRAGPGFALAIADFAGIEARGIAWCAGEEKQLDLFQQGADNYCDLASMIFGRPVTKSDKRERAVGKVAVLGCGYAMGSDRFASQCEKDGVELEAVGLTAKMVVETYRDQYPAIAGEPVEANGIRFRRGGIWHEVENVARNAFQYGSVGYAARCQFSREVGSLVIRLPSGRKLYYRGTRIEDRVPGYCLRLNLPLRAKPTIIFDGPKRPGEQTYGGKLVENIIQAVSRDLVADALMECERQGLAVVLHVHDEIVVEVPEERGLESLQQLVQIMSRPPAWASGLPIEVEGFLAARYLKNPPVGSSVLRARNGTIVH